MSETQGLTPQGSRELPEHESSEPDLIASQGRLDLLVSEIALLLMPASGSSIEQVRNTVVERLATYFSVDLAFLRSNDHEQRATILVAEWPKRPIIPEPDPIGVVFFDDDLQMAMTEFMTEPFIARPVEQFDEFRQRIEAASGSGDVSIAVVPLLNRTITVGCLGFIKFGDRAWTPNEIGALQAIAAMLVHLEARTEAEEKLSYQAYHDSLTGLPNRAAMFERLVRTMSRPGGMPVALLFIDVDDMKVINDALGHEVGDRLLKAMGQSLRRIARPGDFVGRMSGDEFVVIIDEAASKEVAQLVAERISTELSAAVDIEGKMLSRSVSIGISIGAAGDEMFKDLFAEADTAMYRAKADGKNSVRLFDERLQAEQRDRYAQEMELRAAIANDEIIVHYQPEVDLFTGQILGVEALVRWNHPERGVLSAGAFIETAEHCGLVVPLGQIVLAKATAQLAAWKKQFPNSPLVLRINASPAELVGRDYAKQVGLALYENSLKPADLCIEVTEHVVMDGAGQAMEVLDRLRSQGIELAIDDFGTGYSSMLQLKRLPVDTLKIDQAFVKALATDVHDQAIVEAMLRLADAFGLAVVAEGVETEEHVIELVRRGCRRAQGFLLARPMGADDVSNLIGKPIMAGRLDLANGDAISACSLSDLTMRD